MLAIKNTKHDFSPVGAVSVNYPPSNECFEGQVTRGEASASAEDVKRWNDWKDSLRILESMLRQRDFMPFKEPK